MHPEKTQFGYILSPGNEIKMYLPYIYNIKSPKTSCAGPYDGEYGTTLSLLMSLMQVNMLYLLLSTGSTQKARPNMTEKMFTGT